MTRARSVATGNAAKGNLVAGSGTNLSSVLSVGANDTVLTADSSTATGLKWATASAGGMTQLATGTLSGSAVNLTSISGSYKDLKLVIRTPSMAPGTTADFQLRLNNNSTSAAYKNTGYWTNISGGTHSINVEQASLLRLTGGTDDVPSSLDPNYYEFYFYDYANTSTYKMYEAIYYSVNANIYGFLVGAQTSLSGSAINEINLFPSTSTFDAGTYILYGVS